MALIHKNAICIGGICFWTNLKHGSPCPECNQPMRLHGYGEFGGHKLTCDSCHFEIEGVDK